MDFDLYEAQHLSDNEGGLLTKSSADSSWRGVECIRQVLVGTHPARGNLLEEGVDFLWTNRISHVSFSSLVLINLPLDRE